MPNIGPMFAASGKLGVGYAQMLLAGVNDEECSRFARIGDTVIESNHPAFILGHLTLYPTRVVGQLGEDIQTVAPPDNYEKLFSHEAKCVDDPDRKIYPPLDEITAVMMDGYGKAIKLLEATADDAFLAENPIERLRERFPTLGSALGFYVGGHMMMHLGQMSAWRRAMGLGSA